MSRQLAYCTNVHAGADLDATVANLQQYAVAVKSRFAPDNPMGIGLWLAAPAARGLIEEGRTAWLADWLAETGLLPFTLNGFPFGDFHQPVVKHRVYRPTWLQSERVAYTLDLIQILDKLLPVGKEGSISTLPIAWGNPQPDSDQLQLAAANLVHVAEQLARLEDASGRLIYLCLEPEPGCVLQSSDEVVQFFEQHLMPKNRPEDVSRYLRVCHDICHSAVMFEEQDETLTKYSAAGLRVGKVQVSSSVRVPFDQLDGEQRVSALDQLAAFAEDRYLHQTCVRAPDNGAARFYEDLSDALADVEDGSRLRSEWRVHFHVPIYLEQFGQIRTSRDEIQKCLRAAVKCPELTHFEVETYAWSVLPTELQQTELSAGIAREMAWLASLAEFAE